MPWFRVDDAFPLDSRVVIAGNKAIGLWVRAGAWAAQQLTDGDVPVHMLGVLGGDEDDAAALVAAGLWDVTDDGGWCFIDWDKNQPTREEVEVQRSAWREKKRRQRRGSSGRYVSPKESRGVSPGDTHGDSPRESRGESPGVSHRPVPSSPFPSSSSSSRGFVASALGWQEEDERLDFLDGFLAENNVGRSLSWLKTCHDNGDLARRFEAYVSKRSAKTKLHEPEPCGECGSYRDEHADDCPRRPVRSAPCSGGCGQRIGPLDRVLEKPCEVCGTVNTIKGGHP